MRWRLATAFGVLGLGLLAGTVFSLSRADGFPHEEHAGLFPTCLGCHRGIPAGEEDRYYSVVPADCARCHDGTREERVDWEAPTRTASNLVFVHAEHAAEVEREGDPALACASCHGPVESGRPRMAVARAAPEICADCHAHEAPAHLASEASCVTCHRPIADVPEIATTRVAAFEQPPSHESGRFLFEHGESADIETCAVCHARQSCTRCHLNAGDLPEIRFMQLDPRIALLVAGEPPEWPEPESHEPADWEFVHGEAVADGSEACANCHAEPSCRSCHGAAEIPQIASLPDPERVGLEGVFVARTRPPGHGPDFATQHGAAVAADMPRCASCHVETQCAECHDNQTRDARGFAPGVARGGARSAGADREGTRDAEERSREPTVRHLDVLRGSLPPEPRPGYHPENFLMRHGAEAFAIQTNCSDCHSTEVFCRDCHQGVGQSIGAGGGGAFHDAQPNWFFEHGRAARQAMESCASCHQQSSCLRCHSAKAGLRINPHGPGFDPDRVANRSTMSCGVCHNAGLIPRP
ncbi:MAG: cytochrome c3 family protein [Gemmatimonadota bacterium]|nr:cytochrome c3 family protein [Gemmatimonadota bacterium]